MADALISTASIEFSENWLVESDAMVGARARAQELGCVPIGPAGGAALRLLAAAGNARTVVELGTGTGVSGLWLLGGMAPDGVLTSVDVEPEHQRAAREAFADEGIAANRFRLINGSAGEVLPRLTDGAYDLVFVDADKAGYPTYLAQAIRLLRPGGIVAFDNVLWSDKVADPSVRDADTVVLRDLGRAVRADERLIPAMLPVGDGLIAAVIRR
ncbi:MAG: putative O-methyltransferase [Pseudonocardiales bacterium]|nr:putative O-methyltransferase [Jatrophihabitantaceae bacterium]MCW2604526.1 putative O-methyltransferase [Pseudonocardiales bacterium]